MRILGIGKLFFKFGVNKTVNPVLQILFCYTVYYYELFSIWYIIIVCRVKLALTWIWTNKVTCHNTWELTHVLCNWHLNEVYFLLNFSRGWLLLRLTLFSTSYMYFCLIKRNVNG